jgi:hypothetical protein
MDAMKDTVSKMNVMPYVEMGFVLTSLILTVIVIFSLVAVDDSKISDDKTKTQVVNARRSSMGLIVMMVILIIFKLMMHFKSTKSAAPKEFLRYF